jgi:hypothetical protein
MKTALVETQLRSMSFHYKFHFSLVSDVLKQLMLQYMEILQHLVTEKSAEFFVSLEMCLILHKKEKK